MTKEFLSGYLDKQLTDKGLFASYIASDREQKHIVGSYDEYFSSALACFFAPKDIPAVRKVIGLLAGKAQNGLLSFDVAGHYPPDTDTNSVVLALLTEYGFDYKREIKYFFSLVKSYTIDGIITVWLDKSRDTVIDPVVIANVLYLAALTGERELLDANLFYLTDCLKDEQCSSRYYHSPDSVLFFVWRMLLRCDCDKKALFGLLHDRLYARIGTTWHTLDLAQRVIMSKWAGLENKIDTMRLESNFIEGSLAADSLFRYGKNNGYFSSPALNAAFYYFANELKS